ncbi:MAG: HAMP domain-containing sensor histidine kinase [Gallionella sp.]|nr:HAMP domain-containing sensor histidine kinase [Gallionella sp.]
MLTLDLGGYLRTGRWLLLVMLVLLHGALLLGVGNPWVHPLLLAHLGVFLLWQPMWRGEREVGGGALLFIGLAAMMAMFWLSWWTIAFWLTGLFGLVGARVFAFRDRWTRLLYLSVMVYLLAVLLLWVVPNLFAAQSTIETGYILIWYVLPLLLLVMAVLPINNAPFESTQTVDFIYSLLLFMLLTLVVLGSLAFMSLGHLDYLDALLRTLFLIGLVLLALGSLWNPRFGFSGLQVMFSRYLLNVGTPFENWLTQLAEAAQREHDAASYLRHAINLLADFPWLSGLSWHSPDGSGQIGQFSEYAVAVQEGELRLTVYAKQQLNPAVLLHVHLLAQLIGYFYQAKQREQSLRDITRLQAVYETGSRLTHDLKNMLQSLLSLTAIAQSREERAQQLLQQQLPLLTQRIELTLSKLKQPLIESETPQLALNAWWDTLKLRNQYQAIDWRSPGRLPDKNIPAALFDCVIDNLIDNALRKRQTEPGIIIFVEIDPEPLRLIVCDSGTPIHEAIAAKLLRVAVVSENGLGIGLYQAERWAEQLGYRLTLVSNRPGRVCFELKAETPARGTPAGAPLLRSNSSAGR